MMDQSFIKLNSERYCKIRSTKSYRIDYYNEELDAWLDMQPLFVEVCVSKQNLERYNKIRSMDKYRVDLYDLELDKFLDNN